MYLSIYICIRQRGDNNRLATLIMNLFFAWKKGSITNLIDAVLCHFVAISRESMNFSDPECWCQAHQHIVLKIMLTFLLCNGSCKRSTNSSIRMVLSSKEFCHRTITVKLKIDSLCHMHINSVTDLPQVRARN